jgi:hypothetical protein
MLTLEQLVGRLTDEPEVMAAFAVHGLVQNLIEESTTVQALARGVQLSLHTPWTVKLPEYAELEKKPKKRPYQHAVIFDATAYAEGTMCWSYAGAPKQEPAGCFGGPLPRGIAWSDSPAALLDRLGPARYSMVDKDTGAPTWLRWDLVPESRFVMIHATPSGSLTDVTFGLLVKKK